MEEENLDKLKKEVQESADTGASGGTVGQGRDLSYRERSRRARIEKQKKRDRMIRAVVIPAFIVLTVLVIFAAIKLIGRNKADKNQNDNERVSSVTEPADTPYPTNSPLPTDSPTPAPTPDVRVHYDVPVFTMTDSTVILPAAENNAVVNEDEDDDTSAANYGLELNALPDAAKPFQAGDEPLKTKYLVSSYMVLVDLDDNTIVAERSSDKVIPPASMTKILTVLVAMDYLTEEDMDKTVLISEETMNYVWEHGCSAVGFSVGQEVCIKDLLYGTIVCSGGDAAMELARYVGGTVENFVELMNERCRDFGISETAHFTNPVGIYDDDLHCTVRDMAVILSCAMQNETLRDVLGTRIYTTTVYSEEYEPYDISNWFIRRIEDKDTDGKVLGAKTGFVNQSGSCAASYLESESGKHYVCVTGKSTSSWRCIYDHVSVYRSYTK